MKVVTKLFLAVIWFIFTDMGPTANCADNICTNYFRKLDKWNKSLYDVCKSGQTGACLCNMSLPFLNVTRRKIIKRQKGEKYAWKPCRVCSEHLVDKILTFVNPDPTVNFGYKISVLSAPREIFRYPVPHKKYIIDTFIKHHLENSSTHSSTPIITTASLPVSSQQETFNFSAVDILTLCH